MLSGSSRLTALSLFFRGTARMRSVKAQQAEIACEAKLFPDNGGMSDVSAGPVRRGCVLEHLRAEAAMRKLSMRSAMLAIPCRDYYSTCAASSCVNTSTCALCLVCPAGLCAGGVHAGC